jgi:hypothetical protein
LANRELHDPAAILRYAQNDTVAGVSAVAHLPEMSRPPNCIWRWNGYFDGSLSLMRFSPGYSPGPLGRRPNGLAVPRQDPLSFIAGVFLPRKTRRQRSSYRAKYHCPLRSGRSGRARMETREGLQELKQIESIRKADYDG